MPCELVIINKDDIAIYKDSFSNSKGEEFAQDIKSMIPFILHSSLDILDELQWQERPIQLNYYGTGHNGTGSNANNGLSMNVGNSIMDTSIFGRSNKNLQDLENCYLGKMDHFYGLIVTGYVTYGGIRFLMVHSEDSTVNDLQCKKFYHSLHELYIKQLLSPFTIDIAKDNNFQLQVKQLANRYLQ